jgi:hypothetical protein
MQKRASGGSVAPQVLHVGDDLLRLKNGIA